MPGDNPAQPYPACDESRGALDGTLKKGLLLREAVSIALGLFSDKGGPWFWCGEAEVPRGTRDVVSLGRAVRDRDSWLGGEEEAGCAGD